MSIAQRLTCEGGVSSCLNSRGHGVSQSGPPCLASTAPGFSAGNFRSALMGLDFLFHTFHTPSHCSVHHFLTASVRRSRSCPLSPTRNSLPNQRLKLSPTRNSLPNQRRKLSPTRKSLPNQRLKLSPNIKNLPNQRIMYLVTDPLSLQTHAHAVTHPLQST